MEYKHFSHQHTMTIYKVQAGQQLHCHGCHRLCHDSIFACWSCKFFLHEHCGNANRFVKHPSHKQHPLILMPNPTYCSSSFLCNGCGVAGSTFSYCCALCEVDLHVPCAYLPPKVKHQSHEHEICISYQTTHEKDSSPQLCKICTRELSSKHWSYLCDQAGCTFRVHTFCATAVVKLGLHQDDAPDQAQPPVVFYI